LASQVSVVVAADGESGGKPLDGVIVSVLLGVFVAVFEGLVAPLEGAAEGKVGGGVHVYGDGVVVGAEDSDFFCEAAFDHGGALGDNHNVGCFEPDAVYGFDGVIAAAVEVIDLIFGELGFALVGDFVAFAGGPDLDDVDLFAGEDDALVGDETDAIGFEAIGCGELVYGGEVDDDAGGSAAKEAGGVATLLDVVAVEPLVTTEGQEHLVEEMTSALLRCLTSGMFRSSAGDVAGLGPEGLGGEKAECDRDREGNLLHGAPSLADKYRATVYVEDFAGDEACEGSAEEEDGCGDLFDVCGAAEGDQG